LVFPGLVATSVFSFIPAWNDFLFVESLIISDTSQSTLPMALLVFYKPDEPDAEVWLTARSRLYAGTVTESFGHWLLAVL
jgi:ABC-type glycerol-3-phosphate transport system permease component